MTEKTLSELRAALDAVDDRLLALLNERARVVQGVASLKEGTGAPFYVPERERAIVARLLADNAGPFPDGAIGPVMQEVISACLSLEQRQRVAYLGPEGTFTHQAVLQQFGSSVRPVPCGTIPAVFDEVQRGGAEFGVVPIENSSQGVVSHTLDSFLESKLRIIAEILVPVTHALLVRAGRSEGDIERVFSHPQALAQCASWLSANLPRAARVNAASTADAARSARGDDHGAAIASVQAARLHGLEVLRTAVQDRDDNQTRFLVIGAAERAAGSTRRADGGDDKTSVMLALPHRAGALYEVLEPLNTAGINISKIESRPAPARAWAYVFFLDLDGHAASAPLARALAEVASRCPLFRVLGSYQRARAS
jgi:chorismate mutase / prephenate dehydratase